MKSKSITIIALAIFLPVLMLIALLVTIPSINKESAVNALSLSDAQSDWYSSSATELYIQDKYDFLYLFTRPSSITFSGQTIYIMNDISLDNITLSSGIPAISGATIVGNNHTISGYTISVSSYDENNYETGLFNSLTNCTIRNITSSGTINISYTYSVAEDRAYVTCGGLVGYSSGTTFKKCTNNGNITATCYTNAFECELYYFNVAGICGEATSSTFTSCINNGDITTHAETRYNSDRSSVNNNTAGIIASGRNELTDCINYGDIDAYAKSVGEDGADAYAAGISANGATQINYCKNYGTITAETYSSGSNSIYASGITTYSATNGHFYCVNYGIVSATGRSTSKYTRVYSSGIAAYVGYGKINFNYCANYGNISGSGTGVNGTGNGNKTASVNVAGICAMANSINQYSNYAKNLANYGALSASSSTSSGASVCGIAFVSIQSANLDAVNCICYRSSGSTYPMFDTDYLDPDVENCYYYNIRSDGYSTSQSKSYWTNGTVLGKLQNTDDTDNLWYQGSNYPEMNIQYTPTYTITALSADNTRGTVSGGGDITEGSTTTLNATALSGYTFAGWKRNNESNYCSTSARYTFTVTEDATYTAYFDPEIYTISVVQDMPAAGTISGTGEYGYMALCELSTTLNPGYNFLGWYSNTTLLSSNTSYSFTVNSSLNIIAKYERIAFDINASSNISDQAVSGAGEYYYGEQVVLTASDVDNRFEFVEWQVNGTQVSTERNYTFIVDSNVSPVAIFKFKYASMDISHVADLFWLAERVNAGYDFANIVFTLTEDLDISLVKDTNWQSIGNANNTFAGIFNAQNYTINYSATTANNAHGNNIILFVNPTGKIINAIVSGNITLATDSTGNILYPTTSGPIINDDVLYNNEQDIIIDDTEDLFNKGGR